MQGPLRGWHIKWFKHKTDAHDGKDLTKVRMRYGADGYAIYWYCLELIAGDLGRDSDITFELKHDAEVIGFNLKVDARRVEEIMRFMVELGLFEDSTGTVTCLKLAKYLDKKNTRSPKIREVINAANKILHSPDCPPTNPDCPPTNPDCPPTVGVCRGTNPDCRDLSRLEVEVELEIDLEQDQVQKKERERASPERGPSPVDPFSTKQNLEFHRFTMTAEWRPSESFEARIELSGLPKSAFKQSAFGEFVSYWMTRPGAVNTQDTWEHKLIGSLKRSAMQDEINEEQIKNAKTRHTDKIAHDQSIVDAIVGGPDVW